MEGVKSGLDDAVTVLVKQHSQVPLIHLNQKRSKSETIRNSAKVNKLALGRKCLLKFPGQVGSAYTCSFFSSPQPPSFRLSELISPACRSAIRPRERESVRWPTLSSSAEGLWVWARNRNSLYRHWVCWRRQESLLHRRALCSLPPRKTYTTDTHNHGNMNILEVCFFPRIHSALISLGGQ